MSEQITKNQHFVPQCLLKYFATGPDSLVNIYDSKRDILRPPTTVNRVLSENYFYDRDNVVENFLAKHVEGTASRIIEGIATNPIGKLNYNRIDLLRFIAVQLNRTPSALATVMEFIDKFTGTMFQRLGELNGFDEDEMKSVKLVFNDPKALLARQTIEGTLNWPLLEDLKWHVLINETNEPFVISDHPVAHYNWHLRNSNELAYTSLTSCGLQVFLPISRSITLCLYDGDIYKMGCKRHHYSSIQNESDVHILNELQIRSRGSYIVFPSASQSASIRMRCNKYPESSLHQNHAWSSEPVASGSDQMKSTHAVWRTQAKIQTWLSVVNIKRRIKKLPIECYDRRPDVVKAHQLYVSKARARSNAL
jgi:hypothetical protein